MLKEIVEFDFTIPTTAKLVNTTPLPSAAPAHIPPQPSAEHADLASKKSPFLSVFPPVVRKMSRESRLPSTIPTSITSTGSAAQVVRVVEPYLGQLYVSIS